MLWWIYEIVFWTAVIFASPYYLFRMKRRGGYVKGFLERFGVFEKNKRRLFENKQPVWIHAVSVGEVEIVLRLIDTLRKIPGLPIVLSTTTSTGYRLALEKLPTDVPVFYYPLDSCLCFGRTHRLLSPRAFILIEAELWPNHLGFCAEKRIPLLLINARLSERFHPRYRRFRWLFKKAFRGFQLVTLQSERDRERLVQLGFQEEVFKMIGSLKYDTARGSDTVKRDRLLEDLAPFANRSILVAGSTHPGEEVILLNIFLRQLSKHPDLLLVLAPRHAERAPEISEMLRKQNIEYVLRSELSPQTSRGIRVLLLNTTGELKYIYEKASLIFIGKSLAGHGGQNIIEPAVCAKPVIFGPHMENFLSITEDFLDAGAALRVRDAEELEAQIAFLLDHPEQGKSLGQKAADLVQSKQGGMDRTVEQIQNVLNRISL